MVKENLKESILVIFEEALDTLEREVRNIHEDIIKYESPEEALGFLLSYVLDPAEGDLKHLSLKGLKNEE